MDWQPIDTAPKDGTEFLTYCPGNPKAMYDHNKRPSIDVSKWRDGDLWSARPSNIPTHWMPLPQPPKEGE